jgi:hypothetical protein
MYSGNNVEIIIYQRDKYEQLRKLEVLNDRVRPHFTQTDLYTERLLKMDLWKICWKKVSSIS